MKRQIKPKSRNKIVLIQTRSLMIGIIGGITSVCLWIIDKESFMRAWLFAWFFWFSIAMGCLGFFMIYRLTGGEWGKSLERILLSGSKTIDILALLFLPIFIGIKVIYPWSHEDLVQIDKNLLHKYKYLNIPFWCTRTVFYFTGFYLLTGILNRAEKHSIKKWSAGGFILIFLIITFASIDWIMSLEFHWYSTVYGMMIMAGQSICGLAFPLFIMYYLQKLPNWNPPLTNKVLRDQGNLQLTTCILWIYLAFAQWLIVWIGNTPETVTWYISRAEKSWSIVAWIVVIAQFLVPFQFLLFQKFKTKVKNLASLGFFLLVAHWIDLYWIIFPAFHPNAFVFNWMVIPTTATIGGIWFFKFLWQMRTLEPTSVESEHTRTLKEALSYG